MTENNIPIWDENGRNKDGLYKTRHFAQKAASKEDVVIQLEDGYQVVNVYTLSKNGVFRKKRFADKVAQLENKEVYMCWNKDHWEYTVE